MGVVELEETRAPVEGADAAATAAGARFFREPGRKRAAAAEGVEAPLPPLMPPPVAVTPALRVAAAELPALPVERADARPDIDAGRPLSVETSRRGGGGRED